MPNLDTSVESIFISGGGIIRKGTSTVLECYEVFFIYLFLAFLSVGKKN